MTKKLFVGNLSWNTTNESLGSFFAQAGKVESANVITDRYTGKGRGFGFVEMSTDEEAKKAMDELNGKELDGRAIVVNEAKEKENRGNNRFQGGFRGNDRGNRGSNRY